MKRIQIRTALLFSLMLIVFLGLNTLNAQGGNGEISLSWAAAKDPEGGKIWYWVHFADGSQITDKRSISFSGLEAGREYNWYVDSYSCFPGEKVLSGCSQISNPDTPHASGSAIARGGRSRSGDSGDSGGGGGGGAAAVIETPTPLPEFYHDHNVAVTCPAAGFCSPNYQKLTNSMVGSVDIIEQGILSTTNVWGAVPAGTRVCFIGKTGGGVMFKDSSITPHPISWLAHYMLGGDTCVDIPGEGTVTLVRGGGSAPVSASPPEAPVSPPPMQQLPAPICQIKLDDTLFLRATPNGQIIGLVWLNSEVPVFTVDGHWYQVEFEGQVGYICRYHRRVLSGNC